MPLIMVVSVSTESGFAQSDKSAEISISSYEEGGEF